jgi:hypothetical protein
MTMTDTTYNGWTNYETWNVALWIDNEQGSYEYWRDRARDALTECDNDKDDATATLADWLADEIKDGNPLNGQASLYSDILRAALSETNWYEIAENWIDEVYEEPEEEEEDADEEDTE